MYELKNLVQEIELGFGAPESISIAQAHQAITNSDAHFFVQGGASSGKTTLAQNLAYHFWKHAGKSVTVLTSNRHLADEFRSGFVADVLPTTLDGVNFMTLNALAYRIMSSSVVNLDDAENEALTLLSGAEEEMDLRNAVDTCIDTENEYRRLFSTHAALAELRDICATCTQYGVTSSRLKELAKQFNQPLWSQVATIYTVYMEHLKKIGKVDSNLLVQAAVDILEGMLNGTSDSNSDNVPDLLIVDDAQELNYLQLNFASQLAKLGTRCIFIGDPKQTVGIFRGAVGDFGRIFGQPQFAKVFSTNQNSGQKLSLQPAKFHQPAIHKMSSAQDCERDIYQKIRLATLDGKHKYSDFAIIARNCSALNSMRKFLSAQNVPTVFGADSSPISRETIYRHLKTKVLNFLSTAQNSGDLKPAQLIWQAWNEMNLANRLQENVILGKNAASSSKILDTVTFLLEYAAKFKARNPENGVQEFFQHVEQLNISPDNIFAAHDLNGVHLLTPATANGRHFQQVFVLEVNERVWPNMKLRGQVFAHRLLADIETSRVENPSQISTQSERKEIRASELQLFYIALTRSESTEVYCVDDEENAPSTFLYPEADSLEPEVLAEKPLTLQKLTESVRRDLICQEIANFVERKTDEMQKNYTRLQKLGENGGRIADPTNWYYANEPLSSRPELPDSIYMSPSKLEDFVKCPLMWFFNKHAGNIKSTDAASLGTAVHACAQKVSDLVSNDIQIDETWSTNKDKVIKTISDSDPTYLAMTQYLQEYMSKKEFQEMSALDKKLLETRAKSLLKRVVGYYTWAKEHDILLATNKDGEPESEKQLTHEIGTITVENMQIPVILSGSVDRIEKTTEGLHESVRIVDWKTGKTLWRPENPDKSTGILDQHNLQMYAYEMLVKAYLENTNAKNGGANSINVKESSLVYLGKSPTGQAVQIAGDGVDGDQKYREYPPFSESMTVTKTTNFEVNAKITEALLSSIEEFYTCETIEARANNQTCMNCHFKNVCPTQELAEKINT